MTSTKEWIIWHSLNSNQILPPTAEAERLIGYVRDHFDISVTTNERKPSAHVLPLVSSNLPDSPKEP